MAGPAQLTSVTIPPEGNSCILIWTASGRWGPVSLGPEGLLLSNGRQSTGHDGGVVSGEVLTVTFTLNGNVHRNETVLASDLPQGWATDGFIVSQAVLNAAVTNNSTRMAMQYMTSMLILQNRLRKGRT